MCALPTLGTTSNTTHVEPVPDVRACHARHRSISMTMLPSSSSPCLRPFLHMHYVYLSRGIERFHHFLKTTRGIERAIVLSAIRRATIKLDEHCEANEDESRKLYSDIIFR